MKTQKNNIYFKKINFLLFKTCLWIGLCFFFINFSFLRPSSPDSIGRELLVFFFLVIFVIFHTSYLYPKFSKKKWSHGLLLFSLILICSGFELLVFPEIFDKSYFYFLDNINMSIIIFCNILLRNFALFIFFIWVEYFYRLILFLDKKDAIQQKEILFLREKQEFEKNFSRKKLLLHYFFNILELVRIKNSAQINDNELIDKINFILYYFLVDAEQDKVELEKELAFYNYYIELENLRHKEKALVNISVLGKTENIFIIPLLFEPIIGNAMKYSKKDDSSNISITFDVTHFPILTFYCGNKYSKTISNTTSSECGLKILKQRLELCYKNKFDLHINQSNDYYEVTLSIEVE